MLKQFVAYGVLISPVALALTRFISTVESSMRLHLSTSRFRVVNKIKVNFYTYLRYFLPISADSSVSLSKRNTAYIRF